MSDHPVWWVGNRNPSITENIIDSTGAAVDLTGATVKFKARALGSTTLLVDAAATIVGTATAGNVRYDWTAGDIATDGILGAARTALVWWEVTIGGKTQDLMEAPIEVRSHSPGLGANSSYVELEEFKSTNTLSGTTFTDIDARRALVAASRAVDYITGQRFYLDIADEARYYTATASRTIRIDPLVSLTSLQTAWDGINFDATWTVGTDFVLEPQNAPQDGVPYTAIRRQAYGGYMGFNDPIDNDRFVYSWPRSPDSIKVTGKFGWADVPAGVKHATSLIAARFFKVGREAPWGVVGFDEQGAVRISRFIPDQELALGMYTRRKLLV